MKALFVKNVDELNLNEINLSKEQSYHQLVVNRVKLNENIMLLDGKGSSILTKVLSVNNKKLTLRVLSRNKSIRESDSNQINIILATPKKSVLESILIKAVELGCNNLFFFNSEFSQNEIEDNFFESPRVKKLLESALIQSNSLFFPEFKVISNISTFLRDKKVILTHPINESTFGHSLKENLTQMADLYLVIGSEGGISESECKSIEATAKFVEYLSVNSPIMRVETAFVFFSGLFSQKSNLRSI